MSSSSSSEDETNPTLSAAKSKRSKRNAPMEVSSKKATEPPRPTKWKGIRPHDPRFSDEHGEMNIDRVADSYSFLTDIRRKEVGIVEESLQLAKKKKNAGVAVEGLKAELKRMRSQDETRKRISDLATAKRELIKKEKAKVEKTGAAPYFFKQSEIKKRVEEKRMGALGKSAAEKAIVKKRKHEASKERKRIPKRRTAGGAD